MEAIKTIREDLESYKKQLADIEKNLEQFNQRRLVLIGAIQGLEIALESIKHKDINENETKTGDEKSE